MKRKRRFVFTKDGVMRYPPSGEDLLQEERRGIFKKTDPLGSWTGVPADEQDMPVQDADDL